MPNPPHQHNGRLPKLPFNKFNGENPRLWCSNCEKYFTMNNVDPAIWVSVSSMYLDGNAACWYESIDNTPAIASWQAFCQALHAHFDRDQHAVFIRQLFQIKQTSTVTDYVEQFTKLVDQLKAYSSTTDPLFYTMRFIDGLRPELKAIILVARPQSLDAAISMALVQEEVSTTPTSRLPYKGDWSSGKFTPKTAWPLPPPPPPRNDKPATANAVPETPAATTLDAKLSAVKAYRRAMGLCYKCGDKWSKDHKCSPQVQLHLVQELWDLLPDKDHTATPSEPTTEEPQVFLAISQSAVTGSKAPRTVRFSGSIQGLSLKMLLDSGSSSSFISETVAAKLQNISVQSSPCRVRIAGGGILPSAATLLNVPWSVGQYTFTSDLRVLPLTAFDMIIVMDWLESFSPMQAHWKDKWLSIPYEGTSVILQGDLADNLKPCSYKFTHWISPLHRLSLRHYLPKCRHYWNSSVMCSSSRIHYPHPGRATTLFLFCREPNLFTSGHIVTLRLSKTRSSVKFRIC
jgi:hypothetical protein